MSNVNDTRLIRLEDYPEYKCNHYKSNDVECKTCEDKMLCNILSHQKMEQEQIQYFEHIFYNFLDQEE